MEFNQQNEDENTIAEEREEHMIPPNSNVNPNVRTAHFLKPLLNPKIQPFPKPPLQFLSSSSDTKDLKKVLNWEVHFRLQSSWNSWVEELQKTHERSWKKVGIFNAIKGSTYKITKDKELMMFLAEKWCPETNTFVFSWGECSITLEDIMILGGFSVMGNSDLFKPSPDSIKYAKIKDELAKSFPIIRRNCCNHITHIGWLDYFMGKGGELEHVAFIFLWLSRFVLRSSLHIFVKNNHVFNIAISLAMGTKIALAPAVLASIYRDLTRLKQRGDSSQLVLWAPFYLLQLWAWERFPGSSPKPASLAQGEPRIYRWNSVNKSMNQNLRFEVESAGDSFIWRPYAMCLENWDIPKFYCDEGMWVVVNSELDEEVLSFVRCLRACELNGLDCVMQYSPHRVGMQFGMDQDIPDSVPRFNDDYYTFAGSSYAKPMEGLKVYLPPRLFEGDVTVQYSRWWRPRLLSVVSSDVLMTTCSRRKRSVRKRKSLSLLMCTSKALMCSSFDGMIPEKPLNVVDKIASGDALLNQQEGVADDKENGKMVDYATSTAGLNEQMADIVAEKEKAEMVDEAAPNTALNELGDIVVAEHWKGRHAQDCELSAMALDKSVNLTELDLGTKSLSLALVEDHSQLGNDAMGSAEVKNTHVSPIDVEEQEDLVKHIQERSLLIEYRIERLEKLVSMYKLVRFGQPVGQFLRN